MGDCFQQHITVFTYLPLTYKINTLTSPSDRFLSHKEEHSDQHMTTKTKIKNVYITSYIS